MKNNPSGISGFYRSNDNNHHTLRIEVDMNETVDGDALRKAADISIKRYDYFSVKFIKEEGELLHSVVYNDRPIVISEADVPPVLLTEESAGHALTINYEGRAVYFNIVHSIADTTGFFEFIKTTLYYYITEKYGREFPAEGIRTADDPVTDEERYDPYLDPPQPARIPELSETGRVTVTPALPWEKIIKTDLSRQTVFKMSVPEDRFIGYCRANGGTPSVVISNLLAYTAFEICGKQEMPFRAIVMKNYRSALKKPLAHNNVIGNIIMNYTEEMCNLPMDKLCAAGRRMKEYQSSDEYALEAIYKRLQDEKKVLSSGDLDLIRETFAKKSAANTMYMDLTVSYVRLLELGALEPYIDAVYTYVDPTSGNMIVEANAVKGKFCFTFLQNSPEDTVVKKFSEKLTAAGVEHELSEGEPLIYPRLKIS